MQSLLTVTLCVACPLGLWSWHSWRCKRAYETGYSEGKHEGLQQPSFSDYQEGYLEGLAFAIENGICGIGCIFNDTPYTNGVLAGQQDANSYLVEAGCVPNHRTRNLSSNWTTESRLSAVLNGVDLKATELGRKLKSRFAD